MADEKKENELTSAVAALTTLVTNLATKVDQLATQSAPAEVAGLKKAVGELATKFAAMETVTKAAIAERERERVALISSLAGNWRCSFGQADLEQKPIDELRKLNQMLQADNFTGRGGPSAEGSEARYAEPRPYFAKDKKEGE